MILFIEPFYGGSHKQLIDLLVSNLEKKSGCSKLTLITLSAKKWHWRARTSALYLSQNIPKNENYKILFCSSVLNLAELIALRQDLSNLKKIIYFHENQLVYPVQKHKDRDFQYGYNQVLSAMVADLIIFNSSFNMTTFLSNIDNFFKIQPDFRPKNLKQQIEVKCKVIYFPVKVPIINEVITQPDMLHIIWPHRWEHDKNPELFFNTLFELKSGGLKFCVSVLGQSFEDVPEIFEKAKENLSEYILHWGRLDSIEEYYKCLKSGHVVVSTANHEFFGVAMLEGVFCGCFPLAPKALVYTEIYPEVCLYNTPNQLFKKLKNFCDKPYLAKNYLKQANIDLQKFTADVVLKEFENVLR